MTASKPLIEIIRAAWLARNKGPTPLSFVVEWRKSHPMYFTCFGLYTEYRSGSALAIRSKVPFTGPADIWRDLGNTGPMPETFPAELAAATRKWKGPDRVAKDERAAEDMRLFREEQRQQRLARGEPLYGLDPDYDPNG